MYAYGLGQAPEKSIQTGAGVTAGVIGATATKTGAGIALSTATAAWAVPVIGGVAFAAVMILSWMRKRGAQKVAATQIVDEAEPLLAQNLDAFRSGPQTSSTRAAALRNFDDVWAFVQAECGRRELGAAGERCISERQPGGVWDWFAAYRVPIEAAIVGEDGGSFFPSFPSFGEMSFASLAIPAALLGVALTL